MAFPSSHKNAMAKLQKPCHRVVISFCSCLSKSQPLGVGFIDELHSIANRLNGFCCIIWNFNAEFFFESHHEFNRVQAVSTEIINEARFDFHFVGINAQVFNYDLLYAVSSIAHVFYSSVNFMGMWVLPRHHAAGFS
jgi:hypothetical protein